jgi:hypothetical protein
MARGWTTKVHFSEIAPNILPCHHVQTGSGAHPASYPTGPSVLFRLGQSSRSVKLTTRTYTVPSLRMCGALFPLPRTSSVIGHKETVTFHRQTDKHAHTYTRRNFLPVTSRGLLGWYPTTKLDGVTIQKTSTWNVTAMKASKLASFPLDCTSKKNRLRWA